MNRIEVPLGVPLSTHGGSVYFPPSMPSVARATLHVQMCDGTAWRYEVNSPHYAVMSWLTGHASVPVHADLYPGAIPWTPDIELDFRFRGSSGGKPFFTVAEDQALLP